jgi:predicted secreted Zn-dependent protease
MNVSTVLVLALSSQAGLPPQLSDFQPASAAVLEAASAISTLPDTTVLSYPVSGRDRRSIRASMSEKSPANAEGEQHDALTFWRYEFGAAPFADGQCRPETIEVRYTVLVVLPELMTRDQISVRERAEWDRYFARVVNHESRHRQIAVEGADRLREVMRAAPTCEEAQVFAASEMERIAQTSVEFDAETQHGATDGAVY